MQELKELTEDLLKKGSQLAQRYADSVQENISLKSKNKELRHKVEILEEKVRKQSKDKGCPSAVSENFPL